MAKRTLEGFLGVLILPDTHVVRSAVQLTKDEAVRHAAYRVKPKGVHITLYQARAFKNLPISVAEKLIAKLNEYLVSGQAGEMYLHFLDVVAYENDQRFLFWNVDQPEKNRRLMNAHGMSVALSLWVEPQYEEDLDLERRIREFSEDNWSRACDLYENTRNFGSALVGVDYLPHITIAADPGAFRGIDLDQQQMIGTASRVVLARMGEWGKIDEILI